MKRSIILIALFIFVLTDGCVEPYNAPVVQMTPRIVVDALLTDKPRSQEVRLYLSSGLDDNLEKPQFISGATVSIYDDQGQYESLMESADGVYRTRDDYAGSVGRRYKLRVTTETGEQLESGFEEMKAAGKIESVYFEYSSNAINAGDPELPHDVLNLYLDGSGAPGDLSLLRWRWRGTYQTQTRPELRTKKDAEGGVHPDPIPCSGYIVDNRDKLISVRLCECCDCWPTEYSNNANVSGNHTVSNTFNRIFLGQVPVDEWRFFKKYHLEVEQLSLTDDPYNFWKLVEAQQQGGTNIFQPNVVKVKGNMTALSGEHEVFGVFAVSAVSHATLEIKKEELPVEPDRPGIIIQDCRYYIENSTNIQPPFW
jgi:hypothetical protein